MTNFLRNRVYLLAFAVVCSVAVAVVAAVGIQNQSTNSAATDSETHVQNSNEKSLLPVVPVRMFKVGSVESSSNKNVFTGTVRARYETPIGFRVGGKILARHVEVGQFVKKGDLLFELDSEDYRLQQKTSEANLRVAQASVKQSTAEEKRLVELRRANAISQSEYDLGLSARDIAMGQQSSAERQLELANNQLNYCLLVADVPGIVTSVQAEAGQVVSAGTPVCVVAQTNQLEAVIDIPENRSSLPNALIATVQYWSLPDLKSTAKLRELSPVADPVTRTYRARFSIESPPADVHLGMTATVSWGQDPTSNLTASNMNPSGQQTTIPSSSLIEFQGQSAVWVATPQASNPNVFQIHPQLIQVHNYGAQTIEVASGLTSGQLIVSAGVQKLDEAMKVRLWEMQK